MKRNTQGLTKPEDIEEEITQRFAMLHLAWNDAYWTRKANPDRELRKYLHILAGINATWAGIMESKQYARMNPRFELDFDLTSGICRCICDILINTHPNHEMSEALAAELMEVTLELFELHIRADTDRDPDLVKSFENVVHILNMKSDAAWEVADAAVKSYAQLVDHVEFGDDYQSLVNEVGPSVAYVQDLRDDLVGPPQWWANNLYPEGSIDQFEHMNCKMCNGPGAPEILAQEEIVARKERLKKLK